MTLLCVQLSCHFVQARVPLTYAEEGEKGRVYGMIPKEHTRDSEEVAAIRRAEARSRIKPLCTGKACKDAHGDNDSKYVLEQITSESLPHQGCHKRILKCICCLPRLRTKRKQSGEDSPVQTAKEDLYLKGVL